MCGFIFSLWKNLNLNLYLAPFAMIDDGFRIVLHFKCTVGLVDSCLYVLMCSTIGWFWKLQLVFCFWLHFLCCFSLNRKLGTSSIRKNFVKYCWWFILWVLWPHHLAVTKLLFWGEWCLCDAILLLMVQLASTVTWIFWLMADGAQQRSSLFVYDGVN